VKLARWLYAREYSQIDLLNVQKYGKTQIQNNTDDPHENNVTETECQGFRVEERATRLWFQKK
jgi:hypothetical protein